MARQTLATLLALSALLGRAHAQHAADNPVVSADDAFGLTVGLESTGIYGPQGVRGFSPQVAGNARIDGLYFDQQGGLSNRVIESSTIRVGISEIGYAFPAPTGIVDYDLRHATEAATGTLIVEAGPFATRSISVDGSLPLIDNQLELPIGANYQLGAPTNNANFGYTSTIANVGAAPQWMPNDRLTLRAFADWQQTSHAQTAPIVFTAGNFLPPSIHRGFLGQDWAEGKYITENFGGTLEAKIDQHWSLAAGLFRSISDNPLSFADLYVNTQADGSAQHLLVGYPDQRVASTSGEARLTGQFSAGQSYHDLVILVRGRNALAHYGGYDVIDAGNALIYQGAQVAEPKFAYTALTHDLTQLWSVGAAYQGRWAGLGQFALGLQKEQYDKSVVSPGAAPSHLNDDPWRLYGAAARPLTGHITAYAGYTQGFEDSGVAPNTAFNRGTILPTTRTWQLDGGIRYALTPKLNLVAGVFDLDKPYFNLDTRNIDRKLGDQRATGLELSVAGQVTESLNVNAGALIGQVHVIGPNLAAEGVGTAAFGQPRNQFLVNLNYVVPKLRALSFDLGIYHFGMAPASVNDAVYDPSVTVYNLGDRYTFNVLGAPATLRVQVQNVTNVYIWNIGLNPGFLQFAPRALIAYLTLDV